MADLQKKSTSHRMKLLTGKLSNGIQEYPHMYCKQNQKIKQVKDCTLVVGVDIGSTTYYARTFDWRGIELGNVFKFSNSLEGFQSLSVWMQRITKKIGKSEVMAGIEPTGHYWFDLGAYLENDGILLVMVNPYAVKQTKELDDNSQSKNDRKDPKVIAQAGYRGTIFPAIYTKRCVCKLKSNGNEPSAFDQGTHPDQKSLCKMVCYIFSGIQKSIRGL